MTIMMAGNADAMPFWLTHGLARRLGLRLSGALREGVLTRNDLAEMVERCGSCDSQRCCLDYLSERPGAPKAPPGECANAATLAELAELQ
ncbi:DUF6455 family protein [Ostreiculturibacter nitratireducens]|uniref:DUF6455 family protein n=1 Tax=Ostreiculturibacter nitratireducens TaxID=3075226 RepID=UPI0031B64653